MSILFERGVKGGGISALSCSIVCCLHCLLRAIIPSLEVNSVQGFVRIHLV